MNSISRLLLALLFAASGSVIGQDRLDFNRDVRTILNKNCLPCHGPDERSRQGGLRLDTRQDATENGVIIPGQADESELIQRIVSADPDEVMPPLDSEKTLRSDEILLLKRWIDQGAQYQEHWAWQTLTRPPVPADPERGNSNSEDPQAGNAGQSEPTDLQHEVQRGAAAIDAFLAVGWANAGVAPVEPASPRERLRRLSYDLRGLPPSTDEVQTFEQDPSDQAFFIIRDQWMSQIAYAEHQAVRWLDLVRWADTSGFVSDEPIASGAYRAWVIQAIDQNMPFDQFSIHQLAGDLLPNPTDDQLIASGYNRIVNTNCEAGAIEQEQLYKLKGEHVRALGTVWLGLTTGCAECHDHKFDPLTAKDYYSLAAFFDDLVEAGVYTPGDRREPLHYVHADVATGQRDRQLVQAIQSVKDLIASRTVDELSKWEQDVRGMLSDKDSRSEFVWAPARLPATRILEGEFELTSIDSRDARESKANPRQLHRHHAAEWITGYLSPEGQKTDPNQDAWFVDVWIDPENRPDMVGFQISNGRYGRLGWQTENFETYYWGDDSSGELSKPQSWSDPKRVLRVGDLPEQSGWIRLRVPFHLQVKPVGGKTFERAGMAWLHSGGQVGWGDSGLELRTDKATSLVLGETAMRRWWERPMNRQVYERRAEFVAASVKTDADQRDEVQQAIVIDAYREHSQPELMRELRRQESELYLLRARAMPVLVSRQSRDRKTTRLLSRGDYQDETGPLVSAAIPSFLDPGDSQHGSETLTRLDLAQWLFDKENPLVARVFVNRLWHQFYGRGISETLEDSGTQGDWPSHLGLLDWLACEFRDSGWNRDHMVRLLTSTQAYQFSSKPTVDLRTRDPANRWHARQSRFRLDAESIRDSALKAAGLLKTTVEVPTESFFPYQPEPYWTRSDKVMYGSRHMIWETSPAAKQYDRSVYTFWKRQNIHPTMLAFDAPTRQECTAMRNVTNTPGQALALLNDPIFVESARVLAMRICEPHGQTDQERLQAAFWAALQRHPSRAESDVLMNLLTHQREHYRQSTDDAEALVSIGQYPAPSPETASEIAAWTSVTRAILNLHEFLNRP